MSRNPLVRAASALACTLLVTASAGCFGPRAQVTRAFALDLPRGASKEPAADAPVVRVRDLEPSPIVDRDNLVLRRSPVELQFPDHLRWAQRPHRLIADAMARALVDAGMARAATRSLGDVTPAYELDGRLERCELDQGKGKARLTLILTVRRFADGAFVWRYRFEEEAAAGAEPDAGVKALSGLVLRARDGALASLQQAAVLAPTAPTADAP